jgi:hypothetical protein
MFNKDFSKDESGEIIISHENIAKMNVMEYIVFNKFFIYNISGILKECVYDICVGIRGLFLMIMNIIVFIAFPISFPIISLLKINYAKNLEIKSFRNK